MSNINPLSRISFNGWATAMKEAFAVKPKNINTLSWRSDYYCQLLTRDYLGSVKLTVPDDWSNKIDYIRQELLLGGQITVTKKSGSVIPVAFTVLERDAWGYPKEIESSNRRVDFGRKRVDCDACVMSLNGNDGGLLPLDVISIFAQKMADCDASIDTNLLNTKISYIFASDTKSDIDDAKKIYTKIQSGEPAIFWKHRQKRLSTDKDNGIEIITLPVRNNYIADLVQSEKMAIRSEFLTIIGVQNNNYEKQERLLVDEVNSNNAEVVNAIALWQDNVNRASANIRKMFNIEFTVKFGGVNNEPNRFSYNVDTGKEGKDRD